MSVRTNKLLAQYKVYESQVRDAGFDTKVLEDQVDELKSNQMRMIRFLKTS